jgi:Flp pilus assembly protein TadB
LQVNCHKFLTEFFNLGAKERFKHRSEQLKAQREAEQKAREEHEAKIKANMTKSTVPIDFSFTDEDRDTALSKMTVAAAKVCIYACVFACIFMCARVCARLCVNVCVCVRLCVCVCACGFEMKRKRV